MTTIKATALETPRKYLTSQEVADQLRMCNGTLQNWRAQGKGPKFTKSGNRVLYTQFEVDKWGDKQLQALREELKNSDRPVKRLLME